MPTLDTYVLFDGRVFPCCHPFAHSKMQVGDLRTQDFDEIWNGRLYRSLRAGLRSGDVPAICRNCSLIHDPPPAREDAQSLASFEGIAAWLGDRDLAPTATDQLDASVLPKLDAVHVTDLLGELRSHATALEQDRARVRSEHDEQLQRLAAEREAELDEWQRHAHALEAERERDRAWMQEPAGLATRCVRKAMRILQRRRSPARGATRR
jgi:hypothetical protein